MHSDLQVDWWCLGILTFELCSGHPPFESATPMQIYSKAPPVPSFTVHRWTLKTGVQKTGSTGGSRSRSRFRNQVQKGIQKVVFPKKLKGNIEALVKGLCNATPSHSELTSELTLKTHSGTHLNPLELTEI